MNNKKWKYLIDINKKKLNIFHSEKTQIVHLKKLDTWRILNY